MEIPHNGRSDRMDAASTARLAEHTFTPRIARTLRQELESRAEHTWLFGRAPFLELVQEVRDAYTAAVAAELAADNAEETV